MRDMESSMGLHGPWKRKRSIRAIAAIDTVFGAALVLLYTYKIIFLDECTQDCNENYCTTSQTTPGGLYMRIVSILSLMMLVSVNYVQIYYAARMFSAVTKKEKIETSRCLRKCQDWLSATKPIFVLFCIKFMFSILFILVSAGDQNGFMIIFISLTVSEWIFKLVAFYQVNGFMQDLNEHLSKPPSLSSFNNVSTLSSGVTNPIYESIKVHF